MIFQTDNCG